MFRLISLCYIIWYIIGHKIRLSELTNFAMIKQLKTCRQDDIFGPIFPNARFAINFFTQYFNRCFCLLN